MNQFTASLWGDEAWAATLAVKPIWEIIQIVARDTSPPLYYLLLHTWMSFFGTSELAIRSLSFLFFLGTALTVYLIGRHLWDNKTGFWAALLTLTNPFLFQYAFEGRMYSLLALTSTLSIYFFLKKQKILFILATLAALYTHHFSLFVVIFEFLWIAGESYQKSKKELWRNFSSFFLIALGYLPWLYPLYYQTSLVGGGFWLGKPQLVDLKNLIWKFLAGSGENLLSQVALYSVYLVLLLHQWFEDKKKSVFLLGWFFTPLLLTYLLSQFFQSIFYDRYLLMIIPAGMLLLASLRRQISFLPLMAMIFALAIGNFQYFIHPVKRPFRELANFVKQEVPSLTRINYNATAHHLFETKYYGIPAPIYSPQPLPFYTGTALMGKNDVVSALPQEPEILVITSEDPEKVSLPEFRLEKSKKFDGLFLLWFQR